MPLARIFTHHPERTTALSEQLQQQGYEVEVSRPEQTNLAPADLEIEFEVCERSDVLDRATELADEIGADVAVAPGVLQLAAQAEATQPQAAHSEVAPSEMHAAVIPAAPLMASASTGPQEHDPEREFEAAFSSSFSGSNEPAAHEPEPLPSVIEIPVMEQAPLPPVAMLDDVSSLRPELVESHRTPDPVPYLAQLTPFGNPSNYANAENQRNEGHAQPEAVQGHGPSVLQRGANGAARALAGARVIAASTAASFRDHLQEYKKLAQVRSAEARAAREARLLDLEQRRTEAQQRAAELEIAREAAAARLVELVRQRDPGFLREERLHEERLHEEHLYEVPGPEEISPELGVRQESLRDANAREQRLHDADMRAIEAAPVGALPKPSPLKSLRHAFIASLAKIRRPMTPQLRAVLTGAAAVSILFVIGMVLGAFYPRTPLASPGASSSHGNATKGVTVQGGGVTLKTGGATTSTGPVKPAQPAASAAVRPAPQVSNKPSPRVTTSRHLVAQQSEQSVGDDVVVRHYSRPVPTQKPKQAGQQAGLKRFSDMDN